MNNPDLYRDRACDTERDNRNRNYRKTSILEIVSESELKMHCFLGHSNGDDAQQ